MSSNYLYNEDPITKNGRVIDFPGIKQDDSETEIPFRWDDFLDREANKEIKKIVLGQLGEDAVKTPLVLPSLPEGADFKTLFSELTHLYIWNCTGLGAVLPELPDGLEVLEVRGCGEIRELPLLSSAMEELWVTDCPSLKVVQPESDLPALFELSLKGCLSVPEAQIHRLMEAAPILRRIDFSNCPQLSAIKGWPAELRRADFNRCSSLERLPDQWPLHIYRLGLRDCACIGNLPDFSDKHHATDYFDLAGTAALRRLPAFPGNAPRTLFIYQSGVELPHDVFGDDVDHNAAPDVFADLGEARWGTTFDDEVKIILLGNGRCGKTSLARRLTEGVFDAEEDTTQGVRLWTADLPFSPVGDSKEPAMARLNIWDFGGQHLYQNTHRLFLQSRAIFLVCGNDSGKGADEAGDRRALRRRDRFEDIEHGFDYWRQQVDALGVGPRGERPPVLVVTTKADREPLGDKWQSSIAGVPEEQRLNFMAVDGIEGDACLAELRTHLQSRVKTLLGRPGDRVIGKRPLAVKQALSEMKLANQKANKEAQRHRRHVTPPNPVMPVEAFRDIVREECAGGPYAKNPDLLLRRFHRSGFLYWNESYLAESIVLDQRWALDGIYSVLDRSSEMYDFLQDSRGLFTAKDLAERAWDEFGYSPSEQSLFIRFMQDCDVAIEILRSYERDDGETVYLAPQFLSSVRRTEAPSAANLTAEIDDVENHVVVRLIGAVAKRQGRDFLRWKWGLWCDDHHAPLDQRVGESMWLEWQPKSAESITGRLVIRIETFQPDQSVYASIVTESVKEFSKSKAVFQSDDAKQQDLKALWASVRGPRGQWSKGAAPNPKERLAPLLRVGISFAGDEKPLEAGWRHTAFPSALREALDATDRKERGGYSVLDYQSDAAKRIPSVQEMLRDLVTGDLMIVVLSQRYLESMYCMQELYDICRLRPGTKGGKVWDASGFRGSVRVFTLPDFERPSSQNEKEWREKVVGKWLTKKKAVVAKVSDYFHDSIGDAMDFIERVAKNQNAEETLLKNEFPDVGPCLPWCWWVDRHTRREEVVSMLRDLSETFSTRLETALLEDAEALRSKAEAVADQIAEALVNQHQKLSEADLGHRLVGAIAKTLEDEDQPVEACAELLLEWLDLPQNVQLSEQFASSLETTAPAEIEIEVIQRCWTVVKRAELKL